MRPYVTARSIREAECWSECRTHLPGRQGRCQFPGLRLFQHAAIADRLDRPLEVEYRDIGLLDRRTQCAFDAVRLFDAALSAERSRHEAGDENPAEPGQQLVVVVEKPV